MSLTAGYSNVEELVEQSCSQCYEVVEALVRGYFAGNGIDAIVVAVLLGTDHEILGCLRGYGIPSQPVGICARFRCAGDVAACVALSHALVMRKCYEYKVSLRDFISRSNGSDDGEETASPTPPRSVSFGAEQRQIVAHYIKVFLALQIYHRF